MLDSLYLLDFDNVLSNLFASCVLTGGIQEDRVIDHQFMHQDFYFTVFFLLNKKKKERKQKYSTVINHQAETLISFMSFLLKELAGGGQDSDPAVTACSSNFIGSSSTTNLGC